jgi:hypothetical protein
MVTPVLKHFAAGTVQEVMPVESAQERQSERARVSHLEAIARSLAGIAPWFALGDIEPEEAAIREPFLQQTITGLERAFSGEHDYLRNDTHQDLVEAAFLSQALLRCPALIEALSPTAQEGLARSLRLRRPILPPFNNWPLFAAEVEALLAVMNQEWDCLRVDYALRQHQACYKGGGVYGDGPDHHQDYYNSYVIHPMLLDVLEAVGQRDPRWAGFTDEAQQKARRFAAIQERMIHLDGTFPVVGRSIVCCLI